MMRAANPPCLLRPPACATCSVGRAQCGGSVRPVVWCVRRVARKLKARPPAAYETADSAGTLMRKPQPSPAGKVQCKMRVCMW